VSSSITSTSTSTSDYWRQPARAAGTHRPSKPAGRGAAWVPKRGASAWKSPCGHNLAPARSSPHGPRGAQFPEHNPVWHDRVGRGPNHRLPWLPQPPRGWSSAAGSAKKTPSWEPIVLWKTVLARQLRRHAVGNPGVRGSAPHKNSVPGLRGCWWYLLPAGDKMTRNRSLQNIGKKMAIPIPLPHLPCPPAPLDLDLDLLIAPPPAATVSGQCSTLQAIAHS
jgi:hypothetical protein